MNPAVVQSMFIHKNPRIGDEVVAHQDSGFLFIEPEPHLIGFWIPLEDVTLQNGCLWFIPGSHDGLLPDRRFIRNPQPPPTLIFDVDKANEYRESDFVPVVVPRGSCVLIDGLVVHRSDFNRSDTGRPVYTFHVIDQHNTRWCTKNWLQPTPELPFTPIFRPS